MIQMKQSERRNLLSLIFSMCREVKYTFEDVVSALYQFIMNKLFDLIWCCFYCCVCYRGTRRLMQIYMLNKITKTIPLGDFLVKTSKLTYVHKSTHSWNETTNSFLLRLTGEDTKHCCEHTGCQQCYGHSSACM